jgi:hypothetical protein
MMIKPFRSVLVRSSPSITLTADGQFYDAAPRLVAERLLITSKDITMSRALA